MVDRGLGWVDLSSVVPALSSDHRSSALRPSKRAREGKAGRHSLTSNICEQAGRQVGAVGRVSPYFFIPSPMMAASLVGVSALQP